MKRALLNLLARIGHLQAQLLLSMLFVLFLCPYALLLRACGLGRWPKGQWNDIRDQGQRLDRLRRIF